MAAFQPHRALGSVLGTAGVSESEKMWPLPCGAHHRASTQTQRQHLQRTICSLGMCNTKAGSEEPDPGSAGKDEASLGKREVP